MRSVLGGGLATAGICVASGAALAADAATPAPLVADPPSLCSNCEAWAAPVAPFRIHGSTWYVGQAGVSAILIASDDGLVLLDGGLPQSAPLVAQSIEAAGFRLADLRLILNSHAHYDHAGGIAALARATGATVAASAAGAAALTRGRPTDDDPQRHSDAFAPVPDVRVVEDGETLRVGALAVTAHLTPGHTPGSTTWAWRSCEEDRCIDIVYADSLTAVSDEGFRFTDDPARVAAFHASIAKVAALPCGVLLSPHPWTFGMQDKLAAREAGPATDPFIDPDACAAYAAAAAAGLVRRIAEEEEGGG